MKTWREALGDAILSGTAASVASTVALAHCGKKENCSPYGTTNAISRWIWGDGALFRDDASARYTGVGYAIHHASATLWATVFEKWFGERTERGEILPAVAGGLLVSTLACFVDYRVTPYRLRPGFEKRLSTRSMFWVYGSAGIAFTARGLLKNALGSRMQTHR